MLTALDENTCGKCPHQLVAGVACDWRPADECPYMAQQHAANSVDYRIQMPIALASETDAIRSFD